MATLTEPYYDVSIDNTQLYGAVFRNITLARNSQINSAVWRVFFRQDPWRDLDVSIAFADTDSAVAFSATPTDIADLPLTSAKVVWNGTAPIGSVPGFIDSPNLAAPLQEVINRSGWASGHNVVLVATARSASIARLSTYNDTPGRASFLLINTNDTTVTPHGTVQPTGRLKRQANLGATSRLSGKVTPSGKLARTAHIYMAGGIGPVGGVGRAATIALSGGIGPSGGIMRSSDAGLEFEGGIRPTGELARSNTIAMAGGIAPVGTEGAPPSVDMDGEVTPTGALRRDADRAFGGQIDPVGDLVIAGVGVNVDGMIQPTGELVTQASVRNASRRVRQGETITLQALYRDSDGDPTDPVDPSVTIIDRNDVVVETSTNVRFVTLGLVEFDYPVARNAPLGIWQARWDGTIDGQVPVEGPVDEEFIVLAAIALPPPPIGFTSLVPAYFYPFVAGSPWDELVATPADYVIANAGDPGGPGPAVNSDYQRVLEAMRATPATVLGYVDTSYGLVELATVQQQVEDWLAFYPGDIGGFFIDQVSSDAAAVDYYTAVAGTVRAVTAGPLVFNPGTWPLVREYADLCDLLVVFEGNATSYLGSYSEPAWAGPFERTRFAHIVYLVADAQFQAVAAVVRERAAGWGYITSGDLPNPYGILPSYWNEEA